MTNEQLAIVLDSIRDRLARAVDQVREDIATTRDPIPVRTHTASPHLGWMCNDETHYEDVLTSDVVSELMPLDEMIGYLHEQIDILLPKE